MCEQHVHLIHHHHVFGFCVTRNRGGGVRRQSRTLM
jgi:hypothetical protein